MLSVSSECKELKYSGDIWCVSVPTEQQLIMVRRVLEREGSAVTRPRRRRSLQTPEASAAPCVSMWQPQLCFPELVHAGGAAFADHPRRLD